MDPEQAPALTSKERRALAYKRYYERRKDRILSQRKESYNQVQKREYYTKNRNHLTERMKARYHAQKHDTVREILLKLKERFPCEQMRLYIDTLLSDGSIERLSPRMLEFWTQ